jgi:hypothetical protein
MNKAKLDNIMEEVLSHVEHKDVVKRLEEEYKKQLLYGLKDFFMDAYYGYGNRNCTPHTNEGKQNNMKEVIGRDIETDYDAYVFARVMALVVTEQKVADYFSQEADKLAGVLSEFCLKRADKEISQNLRFEDLH